MQHRGQFRGLRFLTCGPDSKTHLQYRIAQALVWYVFFMLFCFDSIIK